MTILNSKASPKWLRRLSAVALVNFAAFVIVALLIGGDAFSGREEAGRYFVARGGQYTEVTEVLFYYSRVHFIVASLTLFVALVSALWLARTAGRRIKAEESSPPRETAAGREP